LPGLGGRWGSTLWSAAVSTGAALRKDLPGAAQCALGELGCEPGVLGGVPVGGFLPGACALPFSLKGGREEEASHWTFSLSPKGEKGWRRGLSLNLSPFPKGEGWRKGLPKLLVFFPKGRGGGEKGFLPRTSSPSPPVGERVWVRGLSRRTAFPSLFTHHRLSFPSPGENKEGAPPPNFSPSPPPGGEGLGEGERRGGIVEPPYFARWLAER